MTTETSNATTIPNASPHAVRDGLMTTGTRAVAQRRFGPWMAVVTPTLLVFACYAGLLWQLTWRGWAHSYDSAIYVRSLWGVANGELFNPVVDLHVLSIHGNFVLYLLAPFARVFHPALVLIAAQAGAIAATTWMVSARYRELAAAADLDRSSQTAAAMFGAVAVVIGTPMIANPFLFDVRPDLIGVPLLTWGLLRAHRRGEFDWPAIGVMLLALLVREEFMMVIVGALVATPLPRDVRAAWRPRLVGTSIAVGYWALYWFGFRNWIGDGSYAIAQEVGAAFMDASELTPAQSALYRLEILGLFAAAAGGTVAFGWRWVGAALPGLGLLLVSTRMQDLVLNFHYVQFVAPGLVVASVDGFQRWLRARPALGGVLPLLTAAAITVCFTLSSALPGGGRHRDQNFYVAPGHSSEEQIELAAVYGLIERVPPSAGLAVPHEIGARFADRATIVPTASYVEDVTPADAPADIDWVALPARYWSSVGRMLVDLHGFTLVDLVDGRVALLERSEQARPRWSGLRQAQSPVRCRAPLATWPAAGIHLCGVGTVDGHLTLSVIRMRPADSVVASERLVVFLVDPVTGARDTAWIADGLVPLARLPVGGAGTLVSEHAIAGVTGRADVVLVAGDDGPLHVQRLGADPSEQAVRVQVTW